ncbi:stage IV sporulation protein FB [Texcoconibacillus texcoconensis]|uniref:Stage IV sporulation protein FB n=2 Tax=Texcoconibacillus texcoconensis TaxID=1095777 RepID=A0A840QSW7_9BACI|nr:stage IV sporulation protein FB [Texcoconibacillus texcoconensis]
MMFLIVFVHELGHTVAAMHFRWRIQKIELLPFGGVAHVDEHGNRPIREDFIVTIAGPLQHIWLMGLSFLLLPFDWWTTGDHAIFMFHNLTVLLFNLLPIWPLDGGKILFILYSYYAPFRMAYEQSLILSFILLVTMGAIALVQLPFHLNLWVVLAFLLFHHYIAWKQRSFTYMRFLLERYDIARNDEMVPRKERKTSADTTVIEAINMLHRCARYDFKIPSAGHTVREEDALNAYFDQKQRFVSLRDLAATPPIFDLK